MRRAGSPRRTHICKAFSKALALQTLKIRARAGQEESVRAGEALGEGPGARLWPALARGPVGFRRGRGSQTQRLAPGARAKADAGR